MEIIMLILVILAMGVLIILVSLTIYLVQIRSPQEQRLEDEEQMRWITEFNKKNN